MSARLLTAADRSYSSLLIPRGKIIPFKTQKEYIKKVGHSNQRPFIYDKYLDIEDELNEIANDKCCYSTMVILSGFHNETINIYSHLLPFLFIVFEIIRSLSLIYYENDDGLSDEVINLYGVSMALCFILSVYYHIGCCRAPTKFDHYLLVDLFGVFLCFFTSVVSGVYIGFHCHPKLKFIYTAMNAFIFICILFPIIFMPSCSVRFWLKKLLLTIVLFIQLIPLLNWIFLYAHMFAIFWYAPVGMFGGYICGGIIWHFRFPEVFFPGKFDMIGNSHQWWHILIVFASFSWWYGLHDMIDYWKVNTCDHYYP